MCRTTVLAMPATFEIVSCANLIYLTPFQVSGCRLEEAPTQLTLTDNFFMNFLPCHNCCRPSKFQLDNCCRSGETAPICPLLISKRTAGRPSLSSQWRLYCRWITMFTKFTCYCLGSDSMLFTWTHTRHIFSKRFWHISGVVRSFAKSRSYQYRFLAR